MKILFVGPSLESPGGVSQVINTIINSNLNDYFELDYFDTYSLKGRTNSQSSKFNFSEVFSGFEVAFYFFVHVFRNKPNVVHLSVSSNWSLLEKTILALIAKLFFSRVIMTIHGADFDLFYENSKIKWFFKVAFSFSDLTTFVSKDTYSKFLSDGYKDIRYLPNPVENPIKEISNVRDYIEHMIDFDWIAGNYSRVFMTMSILENRKRVDDIIEAFNKLNDKNAALIISGSGSLSSMIEELCESNDNIFFTGHVSGGFRKKIFEISHCFVNFSEKESFGLTILESLLSGLELISTDVGVLSESSTNILPYTVASVDELTAAMGGANYKFDYDSAMNFAMRYSKESVIEEYRTVFLSLCKTI